MIENIDNWKTQIRKGYLELCILLIIQREKCIYGFELLQLLKKLNLPIKDGTLYPMLNRMTSDGILHSFWETEGNKGHPRKFYSLTKTGIRLLDEMSVEFGKMVNIFRVVQYKEKNDGHRSKTRSVLGLIG